MFISGYLILFVAFVPVVYLNIFHWRNHNHQGNGLNNDHQRKRKQRNVVNMWYNLAVWAIEVIAGGLMVSQAQIEVISAYGDTPWSFWAKYRFCLA